MAAGTTQGTWGTSLGVNLPAVLGWECWVGVVTPAVFPPENLPGRPIPTEVTLLQQEEGFLEIICILS